MSGSRVRQTALSVESECPVSTLALKRRPAYVGKTMGPCLLSGSAGVPSLSDALTDSVPSFAE